MVLSSSGRPESRIDLSGAAEEQPWIASWTDRSTFLVAFLPGVPSNIVEIDLEGRVLWRFSSSTPDVDLPWSMQLLRNGSVLTADARLHVVQELHRDGSWSVRWGKRAEPSGEPGHLFRPRWARECNDGSLLIADSNNHRVVVVGMSGESSEIRAIDATFVTPACVTRSREGRSLICDSGTGRLVEIDASEQLLWCSSPAAVQDRVLSFPRSVQYLDNGRYLIADTAHNRIVEADCHGLRECVVDLDQALFWPRSVRRTLRNTTLVADGRNSRILELAENGTVLHELNEVTYAKQKIPLRDPHDLRLLPNANVLVVDAKQNLVLETSWEGHVE